MEEMRMFPDGSIEGTPEELAAYQHISAAMDRTDIRLAKKVERQANPQPRKTRRPRRGNPIPPSVGEVLEKARELDDGKGVTARDLSLLMGAQSKVVYNRLYHLTQRGVLVRENGVFKFPKADLAQAI
jgi:hypothetical protein